MSIEKITNNFEEAFLSLLLVATTLLVFVEVVMRFGFNAGLHWGQEVTLTLMAWFVLFGASYGVKVGAHIGVDVFVKMLPGPVHRMATLFAVVLCLIYCALFLYGSWVYLDKMYMIGIEMEDLPIQKYIPQSILLIGFATLAYRFVQLFMKVWKGESEGFHFQDEAEESMHIANELKESMTESEKAKLADEKETK